MVGCAAPGLDPLLALLDASLSYETIAPALAKDATADDASQGQTPLAFLSFAPDSNGEISLGLAGTSLKQASYRFSEAAATSLRSVLRTPEVYATSDGVNDRNEVIVSVQLSDSEGDTRVEHSGLELRLKLSSAGQETSTSCGVASDSGLATCRRSVPSSWFSSSSTGSASATLELKYNGELALEQAAGSVTLQRSPQHSSRSTSGMTLSLPASPRFPDDRCTPHWRSNPGPTSLCVILLSRGSNHGQSSRPRAQA